MENSKPGSIYFSCGKALLQLSFRGVEIKKSGEDVHRFFINKVEGYFNAANNFSFSFT